ncbi:MAG: hypothetical protein LLG01_18365 [Planctomycetaceae bacterium]|nr:hypothetical protein [Planctomycetaceae bacterium]
MSHCPFYDEQCNEFFDSVEQLSARLAVRTRNFYCMDKYRNCARYMLLSTGAGDEAPPSMGPWDLLRVSTIAARVRDHSRPDNV